MDKYPDDDVLFCSNRLTREQEHAMQSADLRRGLWIEVYKDTLQGSIAANGVAHAEACAKAANDMITAFDKAFPEVHAAVMKEDR